MRRATLRLLALVAAVALGLAPSAALAVDGSIAHVEPTADGLQVLVSVPADVEVDLGQVGVTVDGVDSPATAALAGTSTAVRRTAVLAIDTSNSMRGDRFGSAKAAALAFVRTVPEDVELGIVSFAGTVTEALAPTTDRDAAREVIRSLSLSRQTMLHDGVLAAVRMAGTEGQRSLLVLSDGADTSQTPLAEVTTAVEEAGVALDVVALEQGERALAALREMTAAGSGRVVEAERTALGEAFSAEAEALARQVLVTTSVPAGVTDPEATVEVTLGGADPVVARAFTTVQSAATPASSAPSPVVADAGWVPPTWVMYAGVGTLGLGLVALVVLLVPRGPAPLTAEQRLTRYAAATDPGSPGSPAPGGSRVDAEHAFAQAKGAAAGVLERNKSLDARITHRLEGAGSELKSSEWLLVHVGVLVASGLVGLLLGGGSIGVGLLLLALGALGPWLYLGIRRSRRRKAFNALLPDTLQLMSGSLAAGLSLAQSIDTIVREGADPVSTEFKRVLVETRLGVPLEDALEGVAERFESKDFEWVVMAIKIQRQVGGNLAELLDTVAATMREREYLRRQVAALAAEGKLSAWVLGCLPPLFMFYLFLTQRDYVIVMFTEPLGILMLVGAAVILSVGAFWMSKLVKVEV
ncbi:VWA domain-containing protein [Nocardioides sp. zg-579]|uniref:VWA domain-containing protein n=1 Tax=Nocardioides marmotae TaxID=2663857 RepID=A0A6I3JBP7_9ACTN|nr:type II secretion system F family protein [Nocardioides marmotae]MCR6031907.1 VWA domain-containing protein [Gordonia jinghuaiqii]MTB95547.1 VWA domain-containing protein [Nocardioides marmotae]QKE00970.1 VWA domain-containing protein [Nocardioides marmotae]